VAFDRSQWDSWERNARKSVEYNDLDGRAAFNFAMTLANVGQYQEAYQWYDVALSKSPSVSYYWEGAIAARICGTDYENALLMTGQYRAVGGDSNAYHAFRAYALDRLGRKPESVNALEKISAKPMLVAMWVIPGFHDYLLCQSDQRGAVMQRLGELEISVARELRIQYCAAGAGELDTLFESFDRTIADDQIIYLTDVISTDVKIDPRWPKVASYMNLP
jgi:tetratricopeptide (TPR) repeat protein